MIENKILSKNIICQLRFERSEKTVSDYRRGFCQIDVEPTSLYLYCRWRNGNRFKCETSVHEAETSNDLGTSSRSSRYWYERRVQSVAIYTGVVDDNLMANAFAYYGYELQVCLMCTDVLWLKNSGIIKIIYQKFNLSFAVSTTIRILITT